MELNDKLLKLAKQLNYGRALNQEHLKALTTCLNNYSENEQYVFFNEAPNSFKTFPKPLEIKDFFKKRPVKTNTKTFKKADCHDCKDDGFVERRRGKVACTCYKGKQMLKQPGILAPRFFKPCPWPNKWQAVAEAANRLDEKALRGAKMIIRGLTDDHIMSILDAYKNNRWNDKLAADAMMVGLKNRERENTT
jgi:hypothetical protein